MSDTISPTSPNERFAEFIKDFTGHVGNIVGSIEIWSVQKIEEMTMGGPLESTVGKIREHGDKIAQILYVLGCLYNFYTSPTIYVGGLILGTLSSASPFPVSFPSLMNGEVLGRTSEENYTGQKTMFTLATLNFYFGRTLIDDTTFASLAGLLTGNTIYHEVKGSGVGAAIKLVGDKLAAITQTALSKLPFKAPESSE